MSADHPPKKTPLYDVHESLGANLVDFAGYLMPLRYASETAEHKAVRTAAGLFDLSHMGEIFLSGPQAAAALDHALVGNISPMAVGKARYTMICSPDGGVLDDLIVYRLAEETYMVVANASNIAVVRDALVERAAAFEAVVDDRSDSYALIALQGPDAQDILGRFTDAPLADLKYYAIMAGKVAGIDALIARTGYTGEDGLEIMLPAAEAPGFLNELVGAGISPAGLGARDTLRLEAGLNLYGQDMDESVSPLAANMGWTVAWEPVARDFVGRRALEAQKAAGDQPKLVGLVLEERGVLRAHQVVRVAGIGEGEITSGSFSPTLNKSIALARVPAATGDRAEVEIRGKWYPVRVVQPSFVRHGKPLI